METNRKLFKIAGIMCGIIGVLWLHVPTFGIFLIACGIYFYTQSNADEEIIYKNRVFNFILATLSILPNLVGSILVYIAQDGVNRYHKFANGINGPPKVIYKRDNESKKIDILIKLGVAMIFIAGFLFATTSWNFINNSIKEFGLITFGIIFMALSMFTELKLKLYRSAYMYWLLSMSLFLLTIVGILYFGIYGVYLSYAGAGSELAYAITFFTATGFIIATYFKYSKPYLLFFCCCTMLIGLSYTLNYANLSQMTIITIVSFIVMIMNIFNKKQGAINTFSKILSYLLFGAILAVGTNNNLEGLIACAINIINLNYLTWIDKKKDESTINVLITYIIIIFGLISFTDLGSYNYSMIALISTAYTLSIIGNIIPTKRITKRISTCVYYAIMFVLFLFAIGNNSLANMIAGIGIPIIFMCINWLIKKGIFNVDSWKLANYVQPFIIFLLLKGIITSFDLTISQIYIYAFLSIIYAMMHCCYRNDLDKKIMEVYMFLVIMFSIRCELYASELYASIMLIVGSLYLFSRAYLEQKDDVLSISKLLLSYILLVTCIYLPFVEYNILNLNYWITSLSFIVLILCIHPFLKHDWLQKISLVYLVVPISCLCHQPELNYYLQLVLTSFEKLYLVFLFIKFFVKNATLSNIILITGIIFSCTTPFMEQSVYTGMYIGILGIILTMIGYKIDDAYPIFITGIIMTVANIIYYLKDVWKILPFWLYLLLGGLIIIIFATYKQIQKQKINKSE